MQADDALQTRKHNEPFWAVCAVMQSGAVETSPETIGLQQVLVIGSCRMIHAVALWSAHSDELNAQTEHTN